jgi:hypothetical protein
MFANMWCKIVALMIIGAAVQGCAEPAQVSGMVAPAPTTDAWVNSPYKGAMSVGTVSGGEETNPLWTSMVGDKEFKEALHHSLAVNKLLAPTDNDAKYIVNAELKGLDQPLMGFDVTVSAKVDYRVTKKDASELAFGNTVDSKYTAAFSDAYVGVERLRLANEGAIRNNIKTFLDRLLGVTSPEPPTPPEKPTASAPGPMAKSQ